jgi:hypothetical protein
MEYVILYSCAFYRHEIRILFLFFWSEQIEQTVEVGAFGLDFQRLLLNSFRHFHHHFAKQRTIKGQGYRLKTAKHQ